ncbi:hypothetical protein ACFO25_15975 [Paenactinomyces guangxiensis]|uniref:Uncharacterized protein n=1 Tax=Paenactinomyces guangxiensis TaxID=1490290 RepID=A0A7W1WV04_9BACL|nr:hypothetical protein [Paenactinomyces guangxiensis]MBA4496346.1 hypothetical protein [Paenactinomyces guangxiensis]MBH8593630.1 hypothetical protein [Paenactinomyces guangxiensis]
MEIKKFTVISALTILVCLILIFGVYVLPITPKSIIKTDNADDIANQIAYMNFLLTFLATLGTITGLAFALYGYYQTQKVPELVKKEVGKQIKEIREEMTGMVKSSLQAVVQLSERSVLGRHNYINPLSPLYDIEEAEATFPELWGLDYFKAIAKWYESYDLRYKDEAIQLMKKHIENNPHHIKAYIYLLFWYKIGRNHVEAIMVLNSLLKVKPELCYEEGLYKDLDWNISQEIVEARNKVLFEAEKRCFEMEKKLDRFFDFDTPTPLEEKLQKYKTNFEENIFKRQHFFPAYHRKTSLLR